MNDEAHGKPPDTTPGSVLRPFEPPTQPPLPPVEPSRVVPAPPVIVEAPPAPAPPVTPSPPEVPGPPLETPFATFAPTQEHEAVGDDTGVDVDAADVGVADSIEPEPAADAFLTADPSPETEAFFADEPSSEDDPTIEADTAPETGLDPEYEVAELDDGVAPGPAATVTLPKTPFLLGLGALVAVIAVLTLLWQSSGSDDGATVAADDVDTTDSLDSGPEVTTDPADEVDTVPEAELTAAETDLETATADLATANAEVVSLQTTVATLEARPPAPLPGSSIRRIVIGADAKYISALPGSVAVVGNFGGVSLIDPETNRAVANGNVANAATRVLRTSTSVWLTNYADQQLIRVDPVTLTVAAAYPFPGPDGIDKDGDTLIVASFDDGFVARVNPNDGSIIQQVNVGGKPTDVLSHPDHGLWVALFDTGEIVQIDPDTFKVITRITVGQGPVGISAGRAAIWVTNNEEGTVAKVDPEAGELLFAAPVGNGPNDSVVTKGSVWVTVTDDGTLAQVATADGKLQTVTPLGGASAGGGPTGIDELDGTLWIAMQAEQSVARIDLP